MIGGLIGFDHGVKMEFCTVEGVALPLHPAFSDVMIYSLTSGKYESREVGIIKKTLRADDVVLELGSGVGFLSTFCAKIATKGKVFGVEANTAMIPIIKETYAKNGVSVSITNTVMGTSNSQVPFYVHKDFWASSLTEKPDTKEISIPMIESNEFFRSTKPTYLIADIEGGEYDLFENTSVDGIREIVLEIHPNKPARIAELKERFAAAGLFETNLTDRSVAHFARKG